MAQSLLQQHPHWWEDEQCRARRSCPGGAAEGQDGPSLDFALVCCVIQTCPLPCLSCVFSSWKMHLVCLYDTWED